MNRLHPSQVSAGVNTDPIRLVSIMSGKGGVGKSVLAFNLAERMAADGRRVLLVDADFCAGNLHILANSAAETGISEVVAGQPVAQAAVRLSDNLYLLGHNQTGPAHDLNQVEIASRLVQQLRRQTSDYDLVVIDHASGISDPAVVIASGSDANLLVLIPELTSISDCYGLCKYLYQKNRAIDCRLLLNRISSPSEAEYVWTRFSAMTEQFLSQSPSLAGRVDEDDAVRKSVAAQQPLAQVDPQSPAAAALASIGKTLIGDRPATGRSRSFLPIKNVTLTADTRE